ncbi:Vegetative incompatibility protein HET-E-1 [Trametes pubescens]|uniref:Vegetative incompatibility protein HET-E-1 n=1 Tax=Trametes pubescens TaxID=154538 RepID=A0A1M2V764_TRAPU|nr:Vegetative incompatibility protein HET-E-1 [Trametes pubescens]
MRLLNTSTGQFVWVDDPSTVRYAILSHTWQSEEEGGEQSFADVCELQITKVNSARLRDRLRGDSARPTSLFSHPALSDKIKEFCRIAGEAGYDLVWVDSCCIDKSSSAELSEAINSMYQWYRLADVCYVYLADVPDGDRPAERDSAFRLSRWRTRGWTLQELIAPRRVLFLTQTWRFLGTKMGLASTLEDMTGIDFAILTGTAELTSVSVARRMSWAAKRQTKRIEDEAYCLMGLFGVHMATIYGEGRNAFLRLQETIINTIPDQSIFAWGRSCTVTCDVSKSQLYVSASDTSNDRLAASRHGMGLLALSPQDFESARDVEPLPLEGFTSLLGVALDGDKIPTLHCLFTPQGVGLHLLLLDLSAELTQVSEALFEFHRGFNLSPHCTRQGEFHSLALLRCQDTNGSLVALPLCRLPELAPAHAQEPLVVATHAACPLPLHLHTHPRTIRLGKTTMAAAHAQLSEMKRLRKVYIYRHYGSALYPGDPLSMQLPHRSFGRAATACIAPGVKEELDVLDFHATPLSFRYTDTPNLEILTATTTLQSDTPLNGTHCGAGQDITVGITITNSLKASREPATLPQWSATVQFSVDHSLRPQFIAQGRPVPASAPSTWPASAASPSGLLGQEIPCADDSGGLHTSPVQRTGSGTLHAQAEFVLHAEWGSDRAAAADGESDTGDIRLLRVVVRSTADEYAASRAFQVSVELSERYRPTGKQLARADIPSVQLPLTTLAASIELIARNGTEQLAKSRTAVEKDRKTLWIPAITFGGLGAPPDQPSPESTKLVESMVILEFLAEVFPNAPLLPSDPLLRAKARTFVEIYRNYVSSEYLGAFFLGKPIEGVLKALETLQAALPPDGGFAAGEWSIAEAAVAPFIARLFLFLHVGLGSYTEKQGQTLRDTMASPRFARLVQWVKDVHKRPSFKKTWVSDVSIFRTRSRRSADSMSYAQDRQVELWKNHPGFRRKVVEPAQPQA